MLHAWLAVIDMIRDMMRSDEFVISFLYQRILGTLPVLLFSTFGVRTCAFATLGYNKQLAYKPTRRAV